MMTPLNPDYEKNYWYEFDYSDHESEKENCINKVLKKIAALILGTNSEETKLQK